MGDASLDRCASPASTAATQSQREKNRNMARLMLVSGQRSSQSEQRASGPKNEGEAARQLLEANNYLPRSRTPANGQYEFMCPFHEYIDEPTGPKRNHKTNFYMDATSSQYYCQAASCGERGNLQTLERYFGVTKDPILADLFKSKNTELQEYQEHLTPGLRQPLYDKGLRDDDIDRFRLGWDEKQSAYVIPYLEQRRPVAFRFYDPLKKGPNGSKYWWEKLDGVKSETFKTVGSIGTSEDGSVVRLFNSGDAEGDENGRVFICEGEFKAMVLSRYGLKAVSVPGVTSFKREWAAFFMNAKEVIVLMDTDNPTAHKHAPCHKCGTTEKDDCQGHNPGQEGAAKLCDFFGHRARNVMLPMPDTGLDIAKSEKSKTDINEYIMRDGHTYSDFKNLVDPPDPAVKVSPFRIRTLGEIRADPPPETVFLVDGLLPIGGRLLITGAPKVGKSIFAQNLALSIASGVPFLGRGGYAGFNIAYDPGPDLNAPVAPGRRVLLLDRELSQRSLFDRFNALMAERPGYTQADDRLLVDHKYPLRLDADNAANSLIELINDYKAEVLMLDTAYKFFSGDMENAKSVAKAFAAIDEAIQETNVSVVLTHHHRKGGTNGARAEAPSPDQVMGSFLWTGWPNGTVLLNYKERSVTNPYDVICSFAAFRDAAAPDPLMLGRTKTSINYHTISPFSFENFEDDEGGSGGSTTSYAKVHAARLPLTTENVANVLLEAVPVVEDEFLHQAGGRFGCKPETVKIHLLDILDSRDDFKREGDGSRGNPLIWKYAYDRDEEQYVAPEPAEQLEIG